MPVFPIGLIFVTREWASWTAKCQTPMLVMAVCFRGEISRACHDDPTDLLQSLDPGKVAPLPLRSAIITDIWRIAGLGLSYLSFCVVICNSAFLLVRGRNLSGCEVIISCSGLITTFLFKCQGSFTQFRRQRCAALRPAAQRLLIASS